MTAMTFASIMPVLPELVIIVGAMALLMFGAFKGEGSTQLVEAGALIVLAAALVLILMQPAAPVLLFGGSIVIDAFARFFKVLILIGAAAALIMSAPFWRNHKINRFEFSIVVLLSVAGMMVMVSARDLISLYLGMELMSLSLYVIAAIDRDNLRSTEAGLKYFVLGALSSGMLLYGASLIYGFTGTVSFTGIAAAVKSPSIGLIFGIVFLFAGLAFKVSAVPFHMWTPDVYEGAPTPVTAFFAAAPKVAAMALFCRVAVTSFPAIASQWQQIVVFIAIASMALGSFAAIGQNNIKRLLAYSSIGHVGFALVGLAPGTASGVSSVLIYMAIYLVMTLGTFACVIAMRRDGGQVEKIDQLSGLARTQPVMAFVLAALMFSLAGIPPLAGFFAKFYVFLAAIEGKFYILAVIGVLTSAVGAYYYLRIVKLMYIDEPVAKFLPMPRAVAFVMTLAAVFTILFFVYPAPLVAAANAAAKSLF
jgi:NADH-quinone oxidoreductase subunit N